MNRPMPSLSPGHGLKLMLLGGFDAGLNGRPVAGFAYNKMRALLAYLAVERGREHRREVLAELLWSDLEPTAARDNLRRTLSNLRRALESPAGKLMFSATKHSIRYVSDDYVDVLDFTAVVASCPAAPTPTDCQPCSAQMERLAGLYRGEFMAGFSLPDCPHFEDWIQIQRETLRRRALVLLERLSNCHEQAGAYGRALPFALRYSELDPWSEPAHRRVMRLYALNGQNSAAIGQYLACCHLLKKELGVLPSEETRQLAERIRNDEWRPQLRAAAGDRPVAVLPPLMTQRRQVTVLYCVLNLASSDDPDEAMTLLHAPQARCVEIIRQFSGHIVQTYGGGLLAYFGYPQAREDAARRAVQAALTVTREAVNGIEIRAGVHTGLIVTGADSSMPDSSGQTTQVAIALRHGAAHRKVAISQETFKLVAGYFDCFSLGQHSVPGLAQPLEIFKVLRESGARSRLDAATQLTPLAGRQAEIAKLMGWWQEATQGARQVVLVQGEAGIGKSRLLLALKQRLAEQPHALRELRCFPEFSQSPFHPLTAMLEGVFGFEQGELPELRFGKLAAYLESCFPASAATAVPLLSALLSLPLAAHYLAPDCSAQKQKQQTQLVLIEILYALAARQPLLLIVEDLHWIDSSSLELLSLFVEQQRPGAILTLLTARPEFDPPWQESLEASLLLAPLVEDEVAAMIGSMRADLPAATIRRIVERADGVPLFVEEMAKIAAADHQANIPATLHDLLAARMDQLGEAKATAQLAATLGREFDLDLLRKVSPFDPAALTHGLNALQDAGLVWKVSEDACQFKHALIQEAAYQSQTRMDRQAAHQRIARVLQSDFMEVVTLHPELLAQHLGAGGETLPAIEYWVKAGQRAALHSANLEAMAHFNAALKLVLTLPPGQARDKAEFSILVSMCPVLYAAKGYGSEEVTQANARIAALSAVVGDSPDLFPAKWVLLINTIAVVGSRGVPQAAMQLLAVAQDDPVKQLAARFLAANSSFWLGDFEAARAHGEKVFALYQPEQSPLLLEQFGSDLRVFSASYVSYALLFLGYPEQAQRLCAQMLEQARVLENAHTLAQALCFAGELYHWLNQPVPAQALSAEAIAIAQRHDFSLWLACGAMTHGCALVKQGHSEEGVAQGRASVAGMRSAIGGISVIFLATLAQSCMHLEMFEQTLDLIAQAQADAVHTGDGHYAAELHRLKGECLLALSASNEKEAESCFDQALGISRLQHARLLELRAAISMARLWQQQGKPEDARRLLEEIYSWFSEGFDTFDLQEAARLLRTLVILPELLPNQE